MKVGQRLPDLVRTITLTDMVAYGGATWDSHRLHYDPRCAVSACLDRPGVDGQMLGALFGEQLTRCLGKGHWISRLFFRNTAPTSANETVVCEAEVIGVVDGVTVIQLRASVGNRLVIAAAGAELSTTAM